MASSDKKKLVLPATMAKAGWDVLHGRADIEAVPLDGNLPTAAFHALIADADGVGLSLTPFGEAEIKAAPKLRVVGRHGVGYDTVDVAALTRHRIPLMVTGIANSPSVAEQALYFMFELAKRGAQLHALVRDGRWADRLNALPVDLFGKTVLIVGFGRIGTRLAKVCVALGMRVLIYDPYVSVAGIESAGCAPVSDLDSALPQSDFISIHCPKTPETVGMFGASRLARMKPSAFLINTARGGIIDEAALHAALSSQTIRGVGLDVFDREPPDAGNPLLQLDNVLTAPHMAGVTVEAFDRMAVALVTNLVDALDGKPNLDNVINKEVFGHR